MSRVIDKVRLAIYTKWRLLGKSKSHALRQAGYKESTATTQDLKLVKIGEANIQRALTAKDVTVDYLISKTENIIKKAEDKADISNQHRGVENIAKFVGIDKGNVQITNIWNNDTVPDDDEALTKLARRRKINK